MLGNKKIDNNTNYIKYCEKFYKEKVSNYSINDRINFLAYIIKFMDSNVSQYFSSGFIEAELNKTSNEINIKVSKTFKPNSTLHIMTAAYSVGGHTKLVEQWIDNLDYEFENSVLLIDSESSIPENLEKIVYKNGEIIKLEKASYVDLAEKIALIASNYEKIVLHIHPYEILANLAFANKNFNRPVIFLNHADHKFGCGYSVSNLMLNLSTEGKFFSKNIRGAKNNYVLPIPINDDVNIISKKQAREKLGIDINKKIVLSIASEYKYGKGADALKFINMAKNIVSEVDNCEFVLIGPSRKNSYWNEAYEQSNGKINPLGVQPREILNLYTDASDLYIESFPFASYTALLDVVAHKINTITLKTEVFTMDCIKEENSQCLCVKDIERKAIDFLKNPNNSLVPNIKSHYKKEWVNKYNSIIKEGMGKLETPYEIVSGEVDSKYCEYIYNIVGSRVVSGNHYSRLPFWIKIKLFMAMSKFDILKSKKFKMLKKTFF